MSESPPLTPRPPTIIVVHPKEKRGKCSVEPLRGRADFLFWKYPQKDEATMRGYVRLGLGGPQLNPEDRAAGLLVLDGTWRLAEKMEPDFAELPIRSLGPWRTAYPRKSKLYEDPGAGLATIEAIYAAYLQLGLDPEGLLDEYRWNEEFLELNRELIK